MRILLSHMRSGATTAQLTGPPEEQQLFPVALIDAHPGHFTLAPKGDGQQLTVTLDNARLQYRIVGMSSATLTGELTSWIERTLEAGEDGDVVRETVRWPATCVVDEERF